MAPKRRVKRRVKVAGQETAVERQTRTAVNAITRNPYYRQILEAIRSGAPNSKIAEWGVSRGFFDFNQKTAVGYLQYFRKSRPELCAPQEGEMPGFDHLFDGSQIVIDEETELLRLIALQKSRVGLGFQNEREMNLLMQSNRREVKELRELIMELARLRGLVGNSIDVNVKNYNASVVDDLKSIQQDESQRNTIATLVADLQKVAAQ